VSPLTELTAEQRQELQRITEGAENGRDPVASPLRPRVYSIADLATLPEPTWLLDAMLPGRGLVVFYGPSGIGKSFVALDWALCVASGLAWFGRETRQGAVLYIAAEGASGLYGRIEAWMTEREQQPPDLIRFLPAAVNLLDETGVQIIEEAIDQLPGPLTLMAVDTVARSMPGGDENSARDMGRFIASMDEICQRHDALGLAVHHTGKDGEDERGSSSLRGAADAMLALKPDGASVRLSCTKMKDGPEFDDWTLHLETVAKSCVMRSGTNSGALSATERKLIEGTAAGFGTDWVAPSALLGELGIPRNSFFRSLKALVDRGFLEREDEAKRPRYRVSSEGKDYASTTRYQERIGTESGSTAQSPLLRDCGTETNPDTEAEAIF
jgi:AAA domain